MNNKSKFAYPLLVLLACILSACSHSQKFVAPEIEPPADLIPGYVPEGFKLVSGFQLSGEVDFPIATNGNEVAFFLRLRGGDLFFELKSPKGNDILGVYYQGKDRLILISKSYYPEGSLDLWLAAYEAAQPKPCECECACECPSFLRLDALPFHDRMIELQEVRTIDGTRVAILKGLLGWTTVFVRGDYLLTVESGISLDENLKIVASLLD